MEELNDIYGKYLQRYEIYFRTFTALEWFNALLIYLRTGVSVQLVAGMMYNMTDRSVTVQIVGKNIRKIMWLLGEFKEFDSLMNIFLIFLKSALTNLIRTMNWAKKNVFSLTKKIQALMTFRVMDNSFTTTWTLTDWIMKYC